MITVLEKAIAELSELALAAGDAFFQSTIDEDRSNAWSKRLLDARDSLRALVEAQKSAQPTDAAEKLAQTAEAHAECVSHHVHRDRFYDVAKQVRALGREHAAEIERLEHIEAARSLSAASWNRERNARIAAEAKANELAAERDADRAEAKRLREILLALDAARLIERTRPKDPDHCARCCAATLVFDELHRIKAALSDKGSGADPASGSQGASSAPSPIDAVSIEMLEAATPAEEHARHSGEQDLSTCLDALAADLAKTDAVVEELYAFVLVAAEGNGWPREDDLRKAMRAKANREGGTSEAELRKRVLAKVDKPASPVSADDAWPHDCDGCESTFDTASEPAYCHECWSMPWGLVQDLLKAIDPALAAEEDEDYSDSRAIVAKACEQVKSAPVMHLPAQMESLRRRLDALRSYVIAGSVGPPEDLRKLRDLFDACYRALPVEHDDQQGGKPVRP